MKIRIKYFASLREKAGKSQEEFELSGGQSLDELYTRLSFQYGFSLSGREVKYSVNNEYVDNSFKLQENDTVVFIPPVAGG